MIKTKTVLARYHMTLTKVHITIITKKVIIQNFN